MQLKKKSPIPKPVIHKKRSQNKQTTEKEQKVKDSLDSLFDISSEDSVQVKYQLVLIVIHPQDFPSFVQELSRNIHFLRLAEIT